MRIGCLVTLPNVGPLPFDTQANSLCFSPAFFNEQIWYRSSQVGCVDHLCDFYLPVREARMLPHLAHLTGIYQSCIIQNSPCYTHVFWVFVRFLSIWKVLLSC